MKTIRSILTATPFDEIVAAFRAEWGDRPMASFDWSAVVPVRTDAVAFIDRAPWENPDGWRNMVNIEEGGAAVSSLAYSMGELAEMPVIDRGGRLEDAAIAAALLYEIGFHRDREDFRIDLEDIAHREKR